MSRRRSLVLAAVLVVFAGCRRERQPVVDPTIGRTLPAFEVPPQEPGQDHEHALVFGDWGTGREGQRIVARAMAARARAQPIDFIVSTGDNFYIEGVSSPDDSLWEDVFEEVYDDPALQVPFYASLGNHDHEGDPDAQVEYGRTHERWVMPARHYEFTRTLDDGTQAHFFAIDSTPIHSEHAGFEAQLAWLDAALGRSRARWKVVFGHHPLYTFSGRGDDLRMIEHLEPLLVRHGVHLYFAGHDHILELLPPVKGVQYVVSGGGGGPDGAGRVTWREPTVYAATGGGFVALRIGRDELVLEFVRNDARTQFAHVLRAADRDAAQVQPAGPPVEATPPGSAR